MKNSKKQMAGVVSKSRLEQLKNLLLLLANTIDQEPGARDMAALSKQYRETLKEIEEIEGTNDSNGEIDELLSARKASGKPSAVRKGSA